MNNFIEILLKPDNVPIAGMLVLVIFFYWYALKQAIKNDKTHLENRKQPDAIHTWPYLVRIEFVTTIIVTAILIIWSILIDAPLEEIANPNKTPNPSKAPWYFLGLQEMLVYFDPWIAGVVLPGLIIVGLMIIPYIDINPKGNGYYTFKERKFSILTFSFGFVVLWAFMIIIGTFFRGPGWYLFWPWQEWDTHKIVAITNVNLYDLVNLNQKQAFFFGGGIIAFYYSLGILLYFYLKKKNSEFLNKLGIIRYSIVAFLFLTMIALPIKIILNLLFHIKYIWVTPWFYI